MHYVAVIDKDPGSAYGVQFPEVPGCYSAADSFDDIVPNAIEALSLFFEDGEPAPPRGVEAVREEVAGNIAEGAVLTQWTSRSMPRQTFRRTRGRPVSPRVTSARTGTVDKFQGS